MNIFQELIKGGWIRDPALSSKKIVVATSGFWNPIHVGHLDCLEACKKLGDKLIVIVNSDKQVALKGSVPFMNETDRLRIIKSLRCVDDAIIASYETDDTICEALRHIKPDIFAKGGDRKTSDPREAKVMSEIGCKAVFGMGGEKIRASSEIIKKATKKVKQ